MNKEIIKAQAETITEVFERLTHHKMKHSVALEILSALYGMKNYNVLADYINPQTALGELCDMEREHAEDNMDNDYGPECIVGTLNGRQLVSPAYPDECDYIRVTDRANHEIAYWVADEWEQSPAEVMGAIMGALNGGTHKKLPQFATKRATIPQLATALTYEKALEHIEQSNGSFEAIISLSLETFYGDSKNLEFWAEKSILGSLADKGFILKYLTYEKIAIDGDNVIVQVNGKITL